MIQLWGLQKTTTMHMDSSLEVYSFPVIVLSRTLLGQFALLLHWHFVRNPASTSLMEMQVRSSNSKLPGDDSKVVAPS